MTRPSRLLLLMALVMKFVSTPAQVTGPVKEWLDRLAANVKKVDPVNHQVASKWYAYLSLTMHRALELRDRLDDASYRDVPDNVIICYAAHAYLTATFPAMSTMHDQLITKHLEGVPDNVREAARNVGERAAYALIRKCVSDGFAVWSAFKLPRPATGVYRLEVNQTVQHPQWGYTKPLTISRDDVDVISKKYNARGRSWYGSKRYYEDLELTRHRGGKTASNVRTARENLTPFFWADMAGTYATAGHWIEMAASILDPDMSTAEQVRFFAGLTAAMSDASIPCFRVKYETLIWRPKTAINLGDGTTNIRADPTWQPYLSMPNHPTFPSGHSCIAGAAAKFLELFTGSDETDIRTGSQGMDALGQSITEVRHFKKFSSIHKETSMSRVLGGLHFHYDCIEGASLGGEVATLVAEAFGYM